MFTNLMIRHSHVNMALLTLPAVQTHSRQLARGDHFFSKSDYFFPNILTLWATMFLGICFTISDWASLSTPMCDTDALYLQRTLCISSKSQKFVIILAALCLASIAAHTCLFGT